MTSAVQSSEQYRFIDAMIYAGGEAALVNDLPLPAMVACAIVESGYGTSNIYNSTGCPFNLQRPSWYKWVHCRTVQLRTCTKTNAKGECIEHRWAPFCYAEGDSEDLYLRDAARIWCEWVLGWPQTGTRTAVLGLRTRPEEFTRNLPRLGFGEADKRVANGARFVAALRDLSLIDRCSRMLG